ncbi:MAG: hypothetical protein NVSMB6_04120 [Burkholderiaceae bacterium]
MMHFPELLVGDLATYRAPDLVSPAAHMVDPEASSTPDAVLSAEPGAPVGERIIQGLTGSGEQFRPSDWAERLCGAMSCFRPEGYAGRHAHLTYSPYVRPTVLSGIKCVAVNEALRELQPLAYHFVMGFARDNDLQVVDACLLPEAAAEPGDHGATPAALGSPLAARR